jgi:hypothetical protein
MAAALSRGRRAEPPGYGPAAGPVPGSDPLQQRRRQGGTRASGSTGRRLPRHAPLQRPHDEHGRPLDGDPRGDVARGDPRLQGSCQPAEHPRLPGTGGAHEAGVPGDRNQTWHRPRIVSPRGGGGGAMKNKNKNEQKQKVTKGEVKRYENPYCFLA